MSATFKKNNWLVGVGGRVVVILGFSVLLGAVEVRGLLGISLSASGSHGVGLLQSHLHFSSLLYDKHRRSRPLSLAHTQMVFLALFCFKLLLKTIRGQEYPQRSRTCSKTGL